MIGRGSYVVLRETLKYYDRNAEAFVAGTVGAPFTEKQDRFLDLLPAGGSFIEL